MLSVEQAHAELNKHLAEDAPKVQHSKVVASLMKHLAKTTGQDAVLWEVVGLCHDLDDAVTKADRRLHGLLAAGWLEGRLPGEALEAIQAHDHRTGLSSNTQLADALKLADALAIADKDVGREIISGIGSDAGSTPARVAASGNRWVSPATGESTARPCEATISRYSDSRLAASSKEIRVRVESS